MDYELTSEAYNGKIGKNMSKKSFEILMGVFKDFFSENDEKNKHYKDQG